MSDNYNNFEETPYGELCKRYAVPYINSEGERDDVYKLRKSLTPEERENIASAFQKRADAYQAHVDGLRAEGLELDRERSENP